MIIIVYIHILTTYIKYLNETGDLGEVFSVEAPVCYVVTPQEQQ